MGRSPKQGQDGRDLGKGAAGGKEEKDPVCISLATLLDFVR